jgi:hypothetical protein
MAPCASPNNKIIKRQIARKKLITAHRKIYGQTRIEKAHHDGLAVAHLTQAADADGRMRDLEDEILQQTVMQDASKSAASAAKAADVTSIRNYLVVCYEDVNCPVVTCCAHLVVTMYQSQAPAKDSQMKGYQTASGFNNKRFVDVKQMALDHDLLIENLADKTCSFNDAFDELVYNHKDASDDKA